MVMQGRVTATSPPASGQVYPVPSFLSTHPGRAARVRMVPALNRGGPTMSTPRDSVATATALRTVENYIGGRWVGSESTRFGEVFNPATGETIARVPLGSAADVERAVQA